MSLQDTKAQMARLLTDEENKVIALSGKWGTGKSHLWEEVKKESTQDAVKGALYTSLFGVSSIDQIKLKLLQSAAKTVEEHPVIWRTIQESYKSTVKVLQGVHSGFAALNDIGLLVAPAMLRNKVLVLDDIERKHESLSIDAVLGFIDEFTKQHGCRVVLILNDDQLANRAAWDTFREKVIDQELRLSTSPQEAFDIAASIVASPWRNSLRSNTVLCGVTNIRVICKVIKVVNNILGERRELSSALLSKVVPSAVVLASVHYKGIEDGPDFAYILARGNPDVLNFPDEAEVPDERAKLQAGWDMLLSQIGIYSCDDFELLVVEYLQSGLFSVADLGAIIDRYTGEVDALENRELCNVFFERSTWDAELIDADIVALAEPIVAKAGLLDLFTVSSLHDVLQRQQGGADLAGKAIDNWLETFKAGKPKDVSLENVFNQPVHPRIAAEFDAIKEKADAETTLFDACEYIVQRSGWGARQELVLRSATVADFESTIRNSGYKDRRIFMQRMMKLTLQKNTYEAHFGTAMDHFVAACKIIANDSGAERLAVIVKLVFAGAKLSEQLEA